MLYKKSTNGHAFKKRNFVLMSEQLFYYKKNSEDKDPYFNLISLQNARVAIVKAQPELVKKERMYKHCLQLVCEKRKYILASKEEEDLEQWYLAIMAQIEQVQQRVQLQRVNAAILEKEV